MSPDDDAAPIIHADEIDANGSAFDRDPLIPPGDGVTGEVLGDATEDHPVEKEHGLTVGRTAFFLVGEVAGVGILAMPKALHDTGGWSGLLVVIFCGLCSGYTGTVLGRCWTMLQDHYPEYRGGCRYPYQAIGIHAGGRAGRIAVSICMNITLFGAGTVFLLLAAENMKTLFCNLGGIAISQCYWILIVAAVLCPILWLGTPKDFWPLAMGAALATAIAVVLIIIQAGLDFTPGVKYGTSSFSVFFLAFGTMAFAFGGHPTFPTIQDDMKDGKKFGRAAFFAYAMILILYLPMITVGFAVYGEGLKSNILKSITPGGLQYASLILVTMHLLFASNIVWNAVFQETEEILKVPKTFGWKRAATRTVLLLISVFIAETIPTFGVLLDLLGASTIGMLSFVFPGLFYIILNRKFKAEAEILGPASNYPASSFDIPLWEKTLIIEIMLVGLFAAGTGTYAGITEMIQPDSFSRPCFLPGAANNTCAN
ncbi:uncharacterized protein LOC129584441 [Paramacrobiotus metropolitanus]|uniref:uncharacterized protein LOC129584441 n=1 Tax=Paramacrobiotus metropolitanus TaxID=2943436 RepID=UPI0024460E79|nr:uncharacterized protein LOC129584441 [Paramacrobiotus metropolitanus]